MFCIIKTEFQKIKRYHIMLIGIIGMVCSPLLQFFSQMIMAEEYKNPHYDFAALIDATIWGNATIFMPVLIVLIGGYLINREYVDDTLKNVLTIPVSFHQFLLGKLAVIGLLAIVFGVCSVIIAVIISICAGLPDKNILVFIKATLQMVGLSVGLCIVVAPIIILCSQKPGSFMGGSIAAFLTGYCCLFFKKGLLRNIYPFSAVLTLIGYDTSGWVGTAERGNVLLGIASISTMLLVSIFLLFVAKSPETARRRGARKKSSILLRSVQQRHVSRNVS